MLALIFCEGVLESLERGNLSYSRINRVSSLVLVFVTFDESAAVMHLDTMQMQREYF